MSNNGTPNTTGDRLMGRVKWFNNKAGYGFITVTDSTSKQVGNDIFVHHGSIDVEQQQYRYLVQGEYVEFEISNAQSQSHESQAVKVSGINSGKLMCETRHEIKMSRSDYKNSIPNEVDEAEQVVVEKTVSSERKTKVRGDGPRSVESRTNVSDTKEWSNVMKKTQRKSGTTVTK